ncbi:MAG: polysaccharide deacetylase family protein [Verrucomicrobiae bacterium]|nr:polysaccharide deacetylase family protein [Verrucomicrobiae bacterium]
MKKFDVLLGFDMETDVGSWTPFYEGLVHGTPRVLEIFRQHGAAGTFYFTGEAAREHPEIARSVRAAGHEVGAHSLFHETVGDSLFPIPGMRPLLAHEVKPRLELNTAWVEEAAGVRPRSFRCPRLFGSTTVCNALNELGYVSDASYPMYFYRERLTPYHPHRDDWAREGDLSLVEIPNFADMTMESHDEHGRDRDQWPLFRTESADALLQRIDRFLAFLGGKGISRGVLCFYFHPWEFHPMPQGLIRYGEGAVEPQPFIVKNCGDYAVEQFSNLLAGLKQRGGEFKTAEDIAARWR